MLTVKGLTKQINGEEIFNNLNLKIDGPAFIGVVGKTGCGKTTLLNILGGIDEDYSGEVLFNGVNILKQLDQYRKNYVGFLFQKPLMLSKWSIKDNLELENMLFNFKDDHQNQKLLKELDLNIDLNRKMNTLSGGQIQRIALIRALKKQPSILLCDEPTSAIDIQNSELVMNKLLEYSKKAIVIVVSHDQNLLSKYTSNIIDMNMSNDKTYVFKSGITFNKQKTSKIVPQFKGVKLIFNSIKARLHRNVLTSLSISIGTFCLLLTMIVSSNLKQETINEVRKLFPNQCISLRYKDTLKRIDETKANELINANMLGGYLNIPEIELIGINADQSSNEYLYIGDQSKMILPDTKLLAGRLPENENEILLSANTFARLFDEQELNQQEIYALYSDITSEKKIKQTVVGVVDEYTAFDTIYRRSMDELKILKKLFNNPNLQGDFLMLYTKDDINQTIDNLENQFTDMEFKEVGKSTVEKVENVLEKVNYFLYGLSIFVLISVFMLLAMSVYLSIVEKLKEIGLYRLLGASKQKIIQLQMSEATIISLSGITMGVILINAFSSLLSSLLHDILGFNLNLNIGFIKTGLIIIFVFILSIMSALIPILMTKNYRMLDLIKESDL